MVPALYRWNEAKRRRNLEKHGVDFAAAADFDWERALVLDDRRRDYGEQRFRAFGPIRGRLHCLAFTPRSGQVHVISLRKANPREVRRYGESRNASAKEGGR